VRRGCLHYRIYGHIEPVETIPGIQDAPYQPFNLVNLLMHQIKDPQTKKIALVLYTVGLINIQSQIKEDIVYNYRGNPRASEAYPLIADQPYKEPYVNYGHLKYAGLRKK